MMMKMSQLVVDV